MSDDLAQVTEITVTNAPSSVVVESYLGPEGNRGAYVIPGLGSPSTYDFDNAYILDTEGNPKSVTPQLFDWFVNLSPTDPDYLTIFILDKDNIWQPAFKVIPNTYNTNRIVGFLNGSTTTDVVVSKNTLRLSQEFGDQTNRSDLSIFRIPDQDDEVSVVSSQAAMLALSASEFDYAYRTDRSQFFRLTKLPANNVDNWQPELSINADIDIENQIPNTPYPVLSAFVLSKPTFDGENYTFPIAIKATQLNSDVPGGFEPITGGRTAHISLSVI